MCEEWQHRCRAQNESSTLSCVQHAISDISDNLSMRAGGGDTAEKTKSWRRSAPYPPPLCAHRLEHYMIGVSSTDNKLKKIGHFCSSCTCVRMVLPRNGPCHFRYPNASVAGIIMAHAAFIWINTAPNTSIYVRGGGGGNKRFTPPPALLSRVRDAESRRPSKQYQQNRQPVHPPTTASLCLIP